MNPVKFSDLIPEIAACTNHSLSVVGDVLKIYFSEVRNKLTTLAHPRIQVANLGTFCLKPVTTLKRLTHKQNRSLLNGDSFLEVGQLTDVLQKLQLERERKKGFINRQTPFHGAEGKHHPDMESTQPDP